MAARIPGLSGPKTEIMTLSMAILRKLTCAVFTLNTVYVKDLLIFSEFGMLKQEKI